MRAGLERVFPRLWRYALAQTGRRDWADDLAQATCVRAIENEAKFRPGTHLDRWLFTMAHRLWLNELRARKVRQGGGLVDTQDLPGHRGDATETNILAQQVLNRISALPEAQRVTVLLVYVEGYRYAEAADMLDIPMGTVMSRLAAARKVLADWADAKPEDAG